MKKYLLITGLSALIWMLAGCSAKQPTAPQQLASDAYFHRYVALGNSLTAGFQSGGMRQDWQAVSYPALIAQQLGIEGFQQPLIAAPGIGTSKTAEGYPMTPMYLDPAKGITADPLTVNPLTLLVNALVAQPYHNLGIPGATTRDLLMTTSSQNSQVVGNSFFDMILRNPNLNNTTALKQAILMSPGLVTLWIGNNDILGGVLSGTIVPGTTVTPSAYYQQFMEQILDSLLLQTQAEIFMANIPPITAIPYVTTLPTILIDPVTFQPVPGNILLDLQESDVQYVLLSAMSLMQQGYGIPGNNKPLPGTVTLTTSEAASAQQLVSEYNQYLSAKAAEEARIHLVDTYQLMVDLANGSVSGLSSNFILVDSHSAFSLDGVHPNSAGYKQVANLFIAKINEVLGTQVVSVP